MSSFKAEYLLYLPASVITIIMAPPIFNRLRARLAGAPPKADNAVSVEQAAQDQEVLQKAIGDAVAAALNNEDFTKAVASHLALQLQPTLKAALDTSAVETTLQASNERLSRGFDENNSQIASKFSELSALATANNASTTGKISTLEKCVSEITTSLADLGNTLKHVQEQIASPDTTILSSHTATLDKISTTLSTLQEQGPAPVVSAISSHTTKLDAIATNLVAVKENTETASALKAIVSDLAIIKADIENETLSSKSGTSKLSTQLDSITAALEAQSSSLSEIKGADASGEVLAGINASNGSHAAHTNSLSELKAATEATKPSLAELKAEVASIASIVSELKNSNLSTEILAAVKESGESQAGISASVSHIKASNESYSAALGEIKSAITAPAPIPEKTDLAPVETSLKTIIATLDTQNSTLSEIKTAAASTDISATLTTHGSVLAEIKDSKNPGEILAGIEAIKADLGQSKAQLDNLSTEAILEEVKSVKSLVEAIPTPAVGKDDEILTQVESVRGLIEAIPAPTSVTVKDDEILTEIASVKTLIGAIPAPAVGKDDEILTKVESVRGLVEAIPAPASVTIKDDEILTEIASVKTLIGAIPAPATVTVKDDEILEEVKSVKALVGKPAANKENEILTEIRAVQVLIANKDTKTAEAGENDKGVEVPEAKEAEANGTSVKAVEVEPSA